MCARPKTPTPRGHDSLDSLGSRQSGSERDGEPENAVNAGFQRAGWGSDACRQNLVDLLVT
jgi:hypothetical protein